jgi:hypothetical protein
MRSVRAFGNHPDEFMNHGQKAAKGFDVLWKTFRRLINWDDYGNR